MHIDDTRHAPAARTWRHTQLTVWQTGLLCAALAFATRTAHEHWRRAPCAPPPDRPPHVTSKRPPSLTRPAILLFGDSLTERSMEPEGGWGAALAFHYTQKADVISRGFGGYNTRWALPALEQVGAAPRACCCKASSWRLFGSLAAAVPGA